jgi:gamma-glutamylcyclotransferase (GGCT)/AIG2-like uncharacterized protein YtfP
MKIYHTVGMLRLPVAVYGTLKKGFNNHRLLSEAKFIGEGLTIPTYGMYLSGFPVLMEGHGQQGRVKCELYEINSRILQNLDALESNGRMYNRSMTTVLMKDGIHDCQIYIGHPDCWTHRLQHMKCVLPDAEGHLNYTFLAR